MHRFMLLVGMGTSLLAAGCAAPPTPLGAAAGRNDRDAIGRLLRDGHRPDERDAAGGTPLMRGARAGAIDAMTMLLDAGADANARDERNRWTVLMHAVHKHRQRAVALLLERGADPNAIETPGQLVPLLMAAGDQDPGIVELLLDYGANPRYVGEWGETPLGLALSGGALTDVTDRPILGGCHPATVRALLAHEPGLQIIDNAATRRAVWFARFHGCVDAMRAIDEERRPRKEADADQ